MLLNEETFTVTYALQAYIPPDGGNDKQEIYDLCNRSEIPRVVYCNIEGLLLRAYTIIDCYDAEIIVAWRHSAQRYPILSGREDNLLVAIDAICETDMLNVGIGERRECKCKRIVLMREIEHIGESYRILADNIVARLHK